MREEDDESESNWEYEEEPKQAPQNSGTVSDPLDQTMTRQW